MRCAEVGSRSLQVGGQLEVRRAGNQQNSETHSKTSVFGRPEVAQDRPGRAPGIKMRGWAVVIRPLPDPILGPSWADLGPYWPFFGGPRGHLVADSGLGRLES